MNWKSNTLLTALTVLPMLLWGQPVNLEHFSNLKARNIGPAGMSGRVTAVDVPLSDPRVIYAGTASGGVWRSTSGGTDWQPIFDDAPVQSIGALKVNQGNPYEIWVGTGEGNPRNSQNSGNGIYKSIDGGKTWQCMGLQETKTIHRIIIHRDDPNTVFVGATGSAWGPNSERGVFRTTNGGKTWRKVLFVNDSTGCADLVVDPTNPNKMIAALWEYGRKPWTFNSGGQGSGLWVTFDAGETWTRRTDKDGLPKGNLGRIGLAIAPSKPNIVYALVEADENALFKSDDGGFKWQKMVSANSGETNVSNRPFYYHELYVDPKNENRIFSLHSTMTISEDGGKSFQPWVGWKIHPDHHAFWIHPGDPSYMIEGNDGGLNISHDGGKTWRFAENLPLAQFYHIDVDMSIPYRVCGGMQDNGSWVGPSAVWKNGGIRNSDWQEVYFGDGFDVAIRPDDERYCYAMSQGGNLAYIDMLSGYTRGIKPVHPDGTALRFNWNAGFAQNPFHSCGIYYGSQFLHKSLDCGNTWEIISPDLTTNDSTKQQQDKSGGLTIDATSAENFTTIIAIAPSPMDENVIWVGTDDGNVQVTRDGGTTWINAAANMPGANPGAWIPYIEPGKKRAGEAFVVVSDYRRNDWLPFVYHTTDYGATFRRIADEKQVSGPAFCIVQDPVVENLLWMGTDHGLWVSIDFGKNWTHWTNGFPSVTTTDLKIHPRDHDLVIATFGRAAWVLDDIRPIRELAATGGKVLEEPFRAFAAPDAWLAAFRSVDGIRFAGDAMFQGNNRSPMAMITCWVQPPSMKEKPTKAPDTAADKKGKKDRKGKKAIAEGEGEKPKVAEGETAKAEESTAADEERPGRGGRDKPRVKVRVVDSSGDTIRTFSQEVDSGMVRIFWNLRRDGVRFPSRRPQRPDSDPPAGNSVLPGTYKLYLSFGKYADSTIVTVHDDPRLGFRMEALKAQNAAYDELAKTVQAATEGFDRLQDARKNIRVVNEALAFVPDSLKKEITKLGKSLQDSIAALERRYMMPEGLKGIQRDPNTISGTLSRSRSYIGASGGLPNRSARLLMDQAQKEVSKVIADINRFMEGPFADYRQKVEALQPSLFKEYKPLELKE